MASSNVPLQIGDEFKEQFLTCQICYESYDNKERVAKCLPCLHTFCLSCLKGHAGKRPKFNCPQCRGTVTIPDGTVDCLPNNFVVENLKQYKDFINHAVVCGDCDDGNNAVSFCHDCKLFLCQECVDIHLKRRSQRHHKLATMQELQQQNYRPRNEQVCQKHPAQVLALYCKNIVCKVPVCALCGLVEHQGHELIDISEAINEAVAEIKEISMKALCKAEEYGKIKERLEGDREKLRDDTKRQIGEINNIETKLVNLITTKCTQAVSKVKQLSDEEIRKLENKIESVDSRIKQMNDACKFANEACNMNQPVQLLTSLQIKDRFRELENAEDISTSTYKRKELSFTDKHHSAFAEIQKSAEFVFDLKQELSKHDMHDSGIKRNWGACAEQNVSHIDKGLIETHFKMKQISEAVELKQRIDPMECTVTFKHSELNRVIRVDNVQGTIQTVDTNGQLMKTGGAKVCVTYIFDIRKHLGTSTIDVCDNANGTYSFQTMIYSTLSVTIEGKHVRGSPFTVRVYR